MPKVLASFNDQQHVDAVVSEMGRMNVDGLDWRVHQPGESSVGAAPVAGFPAGTAGTGTSGAQGGPAIVAPFFATGADSLDDAGTGDEETFLSQALARGATVIVVDAPSGVEEDIQDLFHRHDGSNVTVS
jgi:hypothetical protein